MTLLDFQYYVDQETRPLVSNNMTDEVVDLLATSNALGGEVGELQNIVKKIVRGGYFYDPHPLHTELLLEAGDVLHYFVRLLHVVDVDIADVIDANIAKLEGRKLQDAAQADSISETPVECRTGKGSPVRDYQQNGLCR